MNATSVSWLRIIVAGAHKGLLLTDAGLAGRAKLIKRIILITGTRCATTRLSRRTRINVHQAHGFSALRVAEA